MQNAWIHAVIDLIAYGRPYFDLHKGKDKPYELLGPNHRIINHDWYQAYGRLWNFHEPFPSWIKDILGDERAGKAEEQMAWIDHDYIDRTWDTLLDLEKKYWEGFFIWILLSPKILKEWAGVDVINGKIQRIIKNHEVWESCPGLKSEYKRLYNYIKAVIKNDKILQNMFERYGRRLGFLKRGREL